MNLTINALKLLIFISIALFSLFHLSSCMDDEVETIYSYKFVTGDTSNLRYVFRLIIPRSMESVLDTCVGYPFTVVVRMTHERADTLYYDQTKSLLIEDTLMGYLLDFEFTNFSDTGDYEIICMLNGYKNIFYDSFPENALLFEYHEVTKSFEQDSIDC